MTGRMPFGKHKGKPLAALPENYLTWLTTINLREPLASAVQHEASRRHINAHTPQTPRQLDADIARQIVQAGYRVLAQKHHPDHGGDTATMQKVNGAAEALRQLVAAGGSRGRR